MIFPRARVALAVFVAASAALAGSSASAGSMAYTLTDLGSLPGGDQRTAARALNNQGEVVGISSGRPFLYSGGTIMPLATEARVINDSGQTAHSTATYLPFAINAAGDTVGQIGGNGLPAIHLAGGSPTVIPGSNGYGFAFGINDAGQVVGSMEFRDGFGTPATHAFLYASGKVTDLAETFEERSAALAINNRGEIVGHRMTVGGHDRPFLYKDGKYTDLGGSLGGDGVALGINDSNQIVGRFGYEGDEHPFLYENGVLTDLKQLIKADFGIDVGRESLVGINNAGQIAFNADINGVSRAFLLTPQSVPEPTTLAFATLAGIAVTLGRRRAACRTPC